MTDVARCALCGEPMPAGEEMFNYHGYSGDCPKPPLPKHPGLQDALAAVRALPQVESASILDPTPNYEGEPVVDDDMAVLIVKGPRINERRYGTSLIVARDFPPECIPILVRQVELSLSVAYGKGGTDTPSGKLNQGV